MLALCSLLLGLVHWSAYLPVPQGALAKPLALALLSAVWPILAGAVVAILLGRWGHRFAHVPLGKVPIAAVAAARRAALAAGNMIQRLDGMLRQWPAAGLSLLGLTILFGAAMLTAR